MIVLAWHIGLFYIAAALLFFLIGGVLALLGRAQLAVPGNTLLGPDIYNQVFTMHGTRQRAERSRCAARARSSSRSVSLSPATARS